MNEHEHPALSKPDVRYRRLATSVLLALTLMVATVWLFTDKPLEPLTVILSTLTVLLSPGS